VYFSAISIYLTMALHIFFDGPDKFLTLYDVVVCHGGTRVLEDFDLWNKTLSSATVSEENDE
jgi:hypothetical protein